MFAALLCNAQIWFVSDCSGRPVLWVPPGFLMSLFRFVSVALDLSHRPVWALSEEEFGDEDALLATLGNLCFGSVFARSRMWFCGVISIPQ